MAWLAGFESPLIQAFRNNDGEYTLRGGGRDDIVTDRQTASPHAIVSQTIVANFAMSTELLVSGLITSKGRSTCRGGVPANTVPGGGRLIGTASLKIFCVPFPISVACTA